MEATRRSKPWDLRGGASPVARVAKGCDLQELIGRRLLFGKRHTEERYDKIANELQSQLKRSSKIAISYVCSLVES